MGRNSDKVTIPEMIFAGSMVFAAVVAAVAYSSGNLTVSASSSKKLVSTERNYAPEVIATPYDAGYNYSETVPTAHVTPMRYVSKQTPSAVQNNGTVATYAPGGNIYTVYTPTPALIVTQPPASTQLPVAEQASTFVPTPAPAVEYTPQPQPTEAPSVISTPEVTMIIETSDKEEYFVFNTETWQVHKYDSSKKHKTGCNNPHINLDAEDSKYKKMTIDEIRLATENKPKPPTASLGYPNCCGSSGCYGNDMWNATFPPY
ncbi:MAG: hypothetical protein IJ608_03515 [Lachnospiraceae bacterium]|nr:hypothetical protein [Lachnospiraceae bacterium]